MKISLIILIFLLFSSSAFCDSAIDGKTVTFTEFIDAMVKADKYTTFENVKVRYIYDIDKPGMDYRFDNGGPELIIKSRIRWLNVDFDQDYWFVMRNVTFKDYIAIFGCKPVKAIFTHCNFEKTFRVYTSELEFIDFDTCNFDHGFKLARTSVKDRLKFVGCKLTINPNIQNITNEYDMENRIFMLDQKATPVDLTFSGCEFNLPEGYKEDPQYFINLTGNNFSNLRLLDCIVNANIDFSQSSVSNTFMTFDCKYNGAILMDAFNVNPLNARVQWSSVNNHRIGVYDPKAKRIFQGGMIDSVHDEFLFNNLISCYANFYNAFRTQGNKIGANECYIEWKNLETKYEKYEYKNGGGSRVYFYYIMNVFLYIFCDYGTNPFKAIFIGLYVLLVFAGIYFFFPYTVKVFGRRSLFTQLKIYGYYLSSTQTPLEVEKAETALAKEPKSYTEYISFLKVTGKKIPWYFHVFGKPLYFLERARELPLIWFYKFIDWFPDEWHSMKRSVKIRATVLYGIIVFFTIIWFLFIHTLDSIVLSINIFSTLGFGEIPIKGIPRYLAILEGFLGWFLLSIFSVSLIGQVIQ